MNNWTDELLSLMVEKLIKRKKREVDAIKGVDTVPLESLPVITRGTINYVKKE